MWGLGIREVLLSRAAACRARMAFSRSGGTLLPSCTSTRDLPPVRCSRNFRHPDYRACLGDGEGGQTAPVCRESGVFGLPEERAGGLLQDPPPGAGALLLRLEVADDLAHAGG